MKPRAIYKYMDTQMLIGLAMFQIEDQLMVSCFLLNVNKCLTSYWLSKPTTIYIEKLN
jgi:hypothetical protein